MPTFNGWNIIPLPAYPPAPSTVDFTAIDKVSANESPFTGQQQTQDWQVAWLEASVSMPPLTQLQAQLWISFLLLLRGQKNVFQIGDPLNTAPAGTALGTPLVNGASQKGFTLATKGWTANAAGVLLPGDFLQIGYRLYRNLQTANADGSGNATLSIWPQIRESPSDGDPLVLRNTTGLFRLKSNERKWSESTARYYGLQFEIREAL